MITPRAEQSLDPLLRQCCIAALAGDADRVTGFERLPDVQAIEGTHAVMLSIASNAFRMIVLLHHGRDAATRAHFAALHRQPPEGFDDQAFADALAESGNLLCGTLNRELGRCVPLLGMSTPHTIGRESMAHLALLRHGLERHWRLSLSAGPAFDVSLVVCDDGDLDFEHTPTDEVDGATAGELEMF